MSWLEYMPAVNATLNGLSGTLLFVGFLQIRRRNIDWHRRFMLSACGCSVLFLCCYLVYHFFAGSTKFQGEGWVRPVYFTILLTHTVLAMVIVPLVVVVLVNAFKGRFDRHRKVARWAFPIWMYVSVTGVLVYFFLYQWFPSR